MQDLEKPIVELRTEIGETEKCEIEIIPVFNDDENSESNEIALLDKRIEQIKAEIQKTDGKIDKLECHADYLDYIVAACAGILTGAIDIFFVGEFSLDKAHEWGTEKSDNFVLKFAQKTAASDKNYKGKGITDLKKAIDYLEKKFGVNYDSAINAMGGSNYHHLDDYSHHPSLFGLIFSIVSQLNGKTFGWLSKEGRYGWFDVGGAKIQIGDGNVFQKFFTAITNWGGHLISDMAGSSSASAGGTGIPGPLFSMFQDGAQFLNVKDPKAQSELQKWMNDAFKGNLKDKKGNKIPPFDLRTELGLYAHIGKQALVVGINEAIVRAFYFIRHLIEEIKVSKIKSFKELKKINWENTIPFKNRTIVRMLTISMSVMEAIDLADAAIRTVVSGSGVLGFAARINYVGLGRTVVACAWDGVNGIQLQHNRNERIKLLNECILLNNAKVLYKQGDLWLFMDDVEKTLEQTIEMLRNYQQFLNDANSETKEDLKAISKNITDIDGKNKGLKDDIKDMLEWGI